MPRRNEARSRAAIRSCKAVLGSLLFGSIVPRDGARWGVCGFTLARDTPRGPCGVVYEDVDFRRLGFVDGVAERGVASADVEGVLYELFVGKTSGGMDGGGSRSWLYMSSRILDNPTMDEGWSWKCVNADSKCSRAM